MIVLGLSAHEHGATAAVVRDGQVIAAAAEERFTRQSHDPNFPRFAIEFCLREAGLPAHALDRIVFHEDPHSRFTRVMTTTLATGFPWSPRLFVRSMAEWLSGRLWVRNTISRRLDVHPDKVSFVPHHLSHAAHALASSPFDEAAVLIAHTIGEWGCSVLCSGTIEDGIEIDVHEQLPYPHSLGLVGASLALFCGFRPYEGVRALSDLAAFGRPSQLEALREIVTLQPDGTYRVQPDWLALDAIAEQPHSSPFTPRFRAAFGEPRDTRVPLPFRSSQKGPAPTPDAQAIRFADLAASWQVLVEEAVLGLARRLHHHAPTPRLCFTGALADNPRLVARLDADGPFDTVFVPPAVGARGAAVGAAMLASAPPRQRSAQSPFVGRAYDETADAEMMAIVEPRYWPRFRLRGCDSDPNVRVEVRPGLALDALVDVVVADLAAGRVVGWVQGRFGLGPHSAGHRLVLCAPANADAAMRLNERVVDRPSWHHSGLAIAEGSAVKVLELEGPPGILHRWGQSTARPRPEVLDQVCEAVHVDGTVRPTVCTARDTPRLHHLLCAFGDRVGLAALLTATLREGELPMAASPADALLVFARTELDTLVINNLLVKKESP